MQKISISKLRSQLRGILEGVAATGEPVVVTLEGEPLAHITAASAALDDEGEGSDVGLAEEPARPARPARKKEAPAPPPPSAPAAPAPTEEIRPWFAKPESSAEPSASADPVPVAPADFEWPPVSEWLGGDEPEAAPEPAADPAPAVASAPEPAPAPTLPPEPPSAKAQPRKPARPAAETPEPARLAPSRLDMRTAPEPVPPKQEPADDEEAPLAELPWEEASLGESLVPPSQKAAEGSEEEPGDDSLIRAIPQHPVAITQGSFASLGLSEPVLQCVRRIGFEHPTPIQAAVIPPALEGRDIVGLAQTGSGKTAAFCLPLAERLFHGRGIRGLILSPTREIALQTKAFLDLFGEDHQLRTVCLIGGVRMGPQIDGLRRKPDILVATPGRLLDHIRRGNVRLDAIEELVLDEADHMLDLGFLPQITDILDFVPSDRRTMLFSATMPPAIDRLAQRLLRDPVQIDILPEGGAADGITHRLYLVDEEDKKACALALLRQELGSTLVFTRRKIDAEWLTRVLSREGHPVERIHSDLSQKQRVRALSSFREGQHRILVATDIAARGLDVPRIQHVINFDLPDQVEDYIHRAGRTARGKLRGTVSSVCTWKDKMMLREIESALGEEIPRCTVPGVDAYVERKTAGVGRGRRKLRTRRRL